MPRWGTPVGGKWWAMGGLLGARRVACPRTAESWCGEPVLQLVPGGWNAPPSVAPVREARTAVGLEANPRRPRRQGRSGQGRRVSALLWTGPAQGQERRLSAGAGRPAGERDAELRGDDGGPAGAGGLAAGGGLHARGAGEPRGVLEES